MQGIDLRMKEVGIRRLGRETMDKLTDEEIVSARCGAFEFLSDMAKLGGSVENGDLEYYFCEVFVKDIIARKEV